jgi:hypothetical protein
MAVRVRESVQSTHEHFVPAGPRAGKKLNKRQLRSQRPRTPNSRQNGQRARGNGSKQVDAHAAVESPVALGKENSPKRLNDAFVRSPRRNVVHRGRRGGVFLDLEARAEDFVRVGRD